MDKKKVLIFGSNGLVGKSLNRVLAKSQKISEIVPSTRKSPERMQSKLIVDSKRTG